MSKVDLSLARDLAQYALASEEALECDWDPRGRESLERIRDLLQGALCAAQADKLDKLEKASESISGRWLDALDSFKEESGVAEKCLGSRLMRACSVALICINRTQTYDRLFANTVEAMELFLNSDGGHREPLYLQNIEQRCKFLKELTGFYSIESRASTQDALIELQTQRLSNLASDSHTSRIWLPNPRRQASRMRAVPAM